MTRWTLISSLLPAQPFQVAARLVAGPHGGQQRRAQLRVVPRLKSSPDGRPAATLAQPGSLRVPRLDARSRLGEFVAAAESASLRDAVDVALLRFDSVYVICPSHNPVGPFDFGGAGLRAKPEHLVKRRR